jgi:hypothetical protein
MEMSNFKEWLLTEETKKTIEMFRNWDFRTPGGSSMSPKTAFDILESEEVETLYDLSKQQDPWRFHEVLGRGVDRDWPANRNLPVGPRGPRVSDLIRRIEANQEIRVYRASDTGMIIPGAYVTESMNYVQSHGQLNIRGSFKMYSISVRPSELMVRGDPHEFIYMPTLQDGYTRYIRGHL